jgi:hypothetical protein
MPSKVGWLRSTTQSPATERRGETKLRDLYRKRVRILENHVFCIQVYTRRTIQNRNFLNDHQQSTSAFAPGLLSLPPPIVNTMLQYLNHLVNVVVFHKRRTGKCLTYINTVTRVSYSGAYHVIFVRDLLPFSDPSMESSPLGSIMG